MRPKPSPYRTASSPKMKIDNNVTIIDKPPRRFLKPAHIISLGFLSVILLGTFFLSLPVSNKDGGWLSFTDSLFTATSAVCVTGLAVVPTAPTFTGFGQAVMLILIQTGGLGLMTLSTLVLMLLRRKITLKDRLVLTEALNRDETNGVVRLVRRILVMTVLIEAVGAALLLPPFVMQNGAAGVWQAVFTSVSAFCNAGFDLFGTASGPYVSLTGYVSSVTVSVTVMLLIVIGGIGFSVISEIFSFRFRFSRLSLHAKLALIVTASLILFGFLFFIIAEQNASLSGLNAGDKVMGAFFLSVTARTAGFNTVDLTAMHPASRAVMMGLMFIGASPGSTGGGIKTTTFAIFLFMTICGFKGSDELVIMKRNIKTKTAYKSVTVVVTGVVLVLGLTVLLLFTERENLTAVGLYSLDYIMFEAFSAFGTVGVSCGITPYLSAVGKFAVAFVMFCGRVGPLTIGVMFVAKHTELLRYPDSSLMIG